jgi:hypothetical protein
MRFENKNQKGELKMKNENQKPKLTLDDIFNIKGEICDSIKDGCAGCPFYEDNLCSSLTDILDSKNRIETICAEWKMTIAEKINEILKPHGMKLGAGNYICFEDENEVAHAKAELIDKLYATKWKGDANE